MAAAEVIKQLREQLAKASQAFEREQARADAAEVRAETAEAAERERCAKAADDFLINRIGCTYGTGDAIRGKLAHR